MSRRFSKRTRLLSFLLSVAMVMMFLPAAAFADSGNSVRVCGITLDSANRSLDLAVFGEGTAEYDPDTNTLTLTNADIDFDDTAVIYCRDSGLIINLVGKNTITTEQTGILCSKALTLTGSGSLKINADGNSIISDAGLTIDGTTIDLTTDDPVYQGAAIWIDGDVTIENSVLDVTATDGNAIFATQALEITSSTVTATGNNWPAIWVNGSASVNGGKLVASGTAAYYAFRSGNGMTIENCDLTATSDYGVALLTEGEMAISGGSVKVYSSDAAGEESYAIQVSRHYESDDDDAPMDAEGILKIGGGAEIYVEGCQGICISDKGIIEDAHIVINSEEWSIDMPVEFADGYDIARAIGGAAKADAEPFDWYSMSLEPYTKNQPGTYHYLELLSGSVHTLTVRNGFANVNGKDCPEDTVQVAAGSTVTLTVDDSAFSSDFVFRSWSVNPTPDDMGNEYARTISFTMPASDVDACAMNRLADEPGYDDSDPFADAAMIAGGAAAVGLAGFGIYELGTELYLKAVLPEGADIPTTRGELALLLWNDAGKPEPAEQPAFTDISDADTAKAAQWVVEAGLMTAEDDTFAPAKRVFKWDVIKAWRQAAER